MNALIYAQKLISRPSVMLNAQNARSYTNMASSLSALNTLLATSKRMFSKEQTPTEKKKPENLLTNNVRQARTHNENFYEDNDDLKGVYKPNRYFFAINCALFGNIILALVCYKIFNEKKGDEIRRRDVEYRTKNYIKSIERIQSQHSPIIARITDH